MKKGGNGHEIFSRINTASQPQLEQEYRMYFTEIRNAVEDIERGTTASIINMPAQSRASTRSTLAGDVSVAAALTGINSGSDDTEIRIRPQLQQFTYKESTHFQRDETSISSVQAPPDTRYEAQLLPIPPVYRIDIAFDGTPSRRHPLLLFRAAPFELILNSREQIKGKRAIQVPAFGSKDFMDRVVPHMQGDKTYSSPFVSFRESPKATLQKLEKRRAADIDEKIFFAVFAFNDVQQHAERVYGPNSGPYLISGIELPYLPGGYTGTTEWLIYRTVECEPIVLLDSAQAILLAQALDRLKRSSDTSALIIVSNCLSDTPAKWKCALAYLILKYYWKKSSLPKVNTKRYHLLMQLIHSGTETDLKMFDSCHSDTQVIQVESTDEDCVLVDSHQPSSASQVSPVTKLNELNSIPSKTSPQHPGRKRRSSPLWSPDTHSESDQDMPIVLEHSPKRRRTSIANVVANVETYVEDDEDYNFTEGLDSLTRKKIKEWSLQPGHQDETILPSTEASQPNSDFLAELYQEAYRKASDTISIPASLHVQAPINCHPENENRFSTKENAHSWTWVNSTRSLGSQGVSSGVKVFTMGHDDEEEEDLVPVKEEAQNGGEEEEDEDVIYVGSNGRDLINLQLRSLSVQ
ncbi:hypothetical protein LTR64_008589 [Lithohypha guttulata]|uniref:uncharacterized protein n=1 Tax=Lithohypha guttulata TaxID=1690604 RepID=UPI002DE11737|nr:hypothetical protein LTR51_001644 [Lithohypha guttulata]